MSKITGVQIPAKQVNYAVNGNLDFWQRVEATTTTVNTATSQNLYTADMINYQSQGATVKNYSIVQSSDVPTLAQSSFKSNFSYLFTMLTGIASFAGSSDLVVPFAYNMEGYDYEKIANKNISFGFWVKASVVGIYSFALVDVQTGAFGYVTTFTITNASTWQFVSIPILMQGGTNWNFTNLSSLSVQIGAYGNASAITSTLNSWFVPAGAVNNVVANTAINWMATTNATLQIAQLSITEGFLGVGTKGFIRAANNISQEFLMCQRYYQKTYQQGTAPASITNSGIFGTRATTSGASSLYNCNFPSMRTTPTITIYNPVSGASASIRDESGASNTAAALNTTSSSGYRLTATVTSSDFYSWHHTLDAGL